MLNFCNKMSANLTFSVLLITLLILFLQLTAITGQVILTTEYLDIKLPYEDACPTPYYDGEDSIYLFGGCGLVSNINILKFSISAETLQDVGSLPGASTRGTIQSDHFGNIFYLGGEAGLYTHVYKFDPLTNTTSMVAELPNDVQDSISIKYNSTSSTVFILGGDGQGNELWAFDLQTLTTSTVLTNLPFNVNQGTAFPVGNKAYIFDSTETDLNRMALELDLNSFELRPVGPPTLPIFSLYRYPSSIWDGNNNYGYVIGGYLPNMGDPTGGLIQFNPSTFENNFIPVRNFPVEGLSYFEVAPGSVFVPSNNRIYFFGGQSFNSTVGGTIVHDDIFYIDLTPLQPTPSTTTVSSTTGPTSSRSTLIPDFFSCDNRQNGLYPHPTDCSLFIKCQNEDMEVFNCSSPMHFDTDGLCCDFPHAE